MKKIYYKPQTCVVEVGMKRVMLAGSPTKPEGEGVENTGQGEQGKPFDAKEDIFGW